MPIQHKIWRIESTPTPLTAATMISEQELEEMIVAAPEILSADWMLIGQQEQTGTGGRIDLLAIAPDASLVLIELKKKRTPREIVAQAIDYASWVERLTTDKITQIYRQYSDGGSLDEAFANRFGRKLEAESLNASHQIVVVASELDAATERIISYLSDRDIAINALFFQVFQHGDSRLLSRAWLIDPSETQSIVAQTSKSAGRTKEPWNGEFYVSYSNDRPWEEARKYGFISGGGGSWYSQTLKMLSPGDRVWVNVQKVGYVGVGRVTEAAQMVKYFCVTTLEGQRPVLDVLSNPKKFIPNAGDPDSAEYFVGIRWLDTVTKEKAMDEVGLFGNQNTVCQPTTPKWRHTVERLQSHFPRWDG
jgi:hypothetical protein